jgi:hypothetical protein
MSLKVYFAVLEEIYNKVVPHWSAVLISCNHSIARLISFTKMLQIRYQFFLYMDPIRHIVARVVFVYFCIWFGLQYFNDDI